jgi:chemotaxis protein CheC
LINIGYGRAASALSELTGHRIILAAPQVELYPIDRVKDALGQMLKGEVASVQQVFGGPVSGHALLLISREGADTLTGLLVDEKTTAAEGRAARREALAEMGNIILQGSMGVCGNLLQIHVSFSVPSLALETVDDLLNSIIVNQRELQFALLVRTRFELLKGQVSGYLVVILGVTSFSTLLEELDNWEARQSA